MTTSCDDIPADVRRANWGWFGEPWLSGICYDDDGRLIEEMRKPCPVGEKCLHCHEPFVEGDSGKATPFIARHREPEIRHSHKECWLREGLGSLAHLERRCPCYGGTDHETSGLTARQEAVAVWDWVQAHGTAAPTAGG